MQMKDYIDGFTNHLKDAIQIGGSAVLKKNNTQFKNVLICGLGGSGIGGTIVNDIFSKRSSIPIITNKDYSVPNFVNEKTLVIVSSYSGNTEETLSALKKCSAKGAEIFIITSGGELKKIAKKNNYNHILIPKGHPPRAMFGYSFTQLLYALSHYNIISSDFKSELKNAILLLEVEKENIQKKSKEVAKKLFGKTPIIYVAKGFEGVAVRFRQQINENAKMLCWHHVIPEMNHNELLGWRINVSNLCVIYLRNKTDHKRNQIRININKTVISKFTKNIIEIWSKGGGIIENSLFHIHFTDWVSWYLSEMNNVDAIEINTINYLKEELAKYNE